MKTIKININKNEVEFSSEILMKHLRIIEPLSEQMQNEKIGKMDFFVKLACSLSVSHGSEELEKIIDELWVNEIQKFTKDFTPILEVLEKFNTESVEKTKK